MGEKPLVGSGHELLFSVYHIELLRKIIVGSLRQNDDDAEAIVTRLAGSVVQRGRIDFNHHARWYAERLAGRGVQLVIRRNVGLLGQNQNCVLAHRDVELAAAMILQCVQELVVAVAIANLDRNKAVHLLLELLRNCKLLQLRITRYIDGPIRRARGLHHALQQLREVIPLHDPAVFPEFRIVYTIDLHVCNPPVSLCFGRRSGCKTAA